MTTESYGRGGEGGVGRKHRNMFACFCLLSANLPSTAHESFASSPGFTTMFSDMDLIVAPSVRMLESIRRCERAMASCWVAGADEKQNKGTFIKIHHKAGASARFMKRSGTYIQRQL